MTYIFLYLLVLLLEACFLSLSMGLYGIFQDAYIVSLCVSVSLLANIRNIRKTGFCSLPSMTWAEILM